MNCEEARQQIEAFTDGELIIPARRNIEAHLAHCLECRRTFHEHQQMSARLDGVLRHGRRTPELWDRLEESISNSIMTESETGRSRPLAFYGHGPRYFHFLSQAISRTLGNEINSCRSAWAGMAVAWAVILLLNLGSSESGVSPTTTDTAPTDSELGFAVNRQQLLALELGAFSDQTAKPEDVRSGRRSERSYPIRNLNG